MRTRDLIMLAMSTLPEDPTISMYIPPDGSEPIEYYGQMEPIVEWIMRTRKENLADLVILCSKETYSTKTVNGTAVSFFATNVCEAFGTQMPQEVSVDETNQFSIYESEDKNIRFVMVPMDVKHPMKSIQSTVEYIREWKMSDDPETAGNFYLDIHGGPRDMDLIQNAIISLLTIDGITPAGVYTGQYSGGEFHHKDASYAYGMFDFVSAMNEFINYGHGKALKTYLDKTGNRTEEELKVTDAMDKVSRGLELCDPETYKSGLNSLKKALDALPADAPSELNIFRDYIKDSFGDLLSSNTRTTLLIVKRCMEKGLFQQALTFIESAMPAEIVDKQLLYYQQTAENLAKLADIAENNHIYGADPKYTFFDYHLKSIKFFSTETFWGIKNEVKRVSADENTIKHKAESMELKRAVAEFAENAADFRSLLNKEKTLQNIKMQTSLGEIEESQIQGIDTALNGYDRELLGYFLRMHKALKRCRNTINHGDSSRPDFEQMQKLLELYVTYGEALYSRVEKK